MAVVFVAGKLMILSPVNMGDFFLHKKRAILSNHPECFHNRIIFIVNRFQNCITILQKTFCLKMRFAAFMKYFFVVF
ncbi:hypothetical protein SAMN05444144_104301 [Flavobacterium akiainvivens]|nr:hypothetical protein SAMN05444144_104301 [Flavobacterium akiainvivens]